MLDIVSEAGNDATGVSPPVADVKIKGIAVCGSNPATVNMTPFNDDWLIYGCSPDNSPYGHSREAKALPRVDVWFELHKPVFDQSRPYEYLFWLKDGAPKVYMRDLVALELHDSNCKPLFPNAVVYPEEQMKEALDRFAFTSSIAYMMAMAIHDAVAQGIGAIGLFGIMQASKNEYTYQRPGIQSMIDAATKRGIKVVAPDISKLFEPMPDIW